MKTGDTESCCCALPGCKGALNAVPRESDPDQKLQCRLEQKFLLGGRHLACRHDAEILSFQTCGRITPSVCPAPHLYTTVNQRTGGPYLDNQDFPAPVCDFSLCGQAVLALPGHLAERGRASCRRLSENEVLKGRGVLHRLDLVPQVSDLQDSAEDVPAEREVRGTKEMAS